MTENQRRTDDGRATIQVDGAADGREDVRGSLCLPNKMTIDEERALSIFTCRQEVPSYQ